MNRYKYLRNSSLFFFFIRRLAVCLLIVWSAEHEFQADSFCKQLVILLLRTASSREKQNNVMNFHRSDP